MGFDIGIIISFFLMLVGSFASLVEEYKDHWLIVFLRFVVPIVGLILTYMRLKKFKTYSVDFDNSKWIRNAAGSYFELIIKQSQHKKGKNPKVDIFEEKNGEYEKIIVDYFVNKDGDLTLKTNILFCGKVSIA